MLSSKLNQYKKFIYIGIFIIIVISVVTAAIVIRNRNLDQRTDAGSNPRAKVGISFNSPAIATSLKSLSSSAQAPSSAAVQANTKYDNIKITISSLDAMNSQAVLRIIFPVTAANITQYGWNMSVPIASKISAKTASGIDFNVIVGDLNNTRVASIYYVDLKPKSPVNANDTVTLTVLDMTTQSLPINNNVFQVFMDQSGNNNFQKIGDIAFNVFSKTANSVKLFIDNTYSVNQNLKVNVTPIFTGDVNVYRFPADDELYDKNVTLKVGAGSTTSVTWPDGTNSASKPEYTFKVSPKSATCARNCTTSELNLKANASGFFYLEGKVEGGSYDGTFGVSNSSSNTLLSDTTYSTKKLAYGDWHSHFNDTKSNLQDDIDYGRLGFKSDFIGGTNKTFYDAYPQNEPITVQDFNNYLALNKQLNKDGQFIAVPNEEWPKAISYYNPYRTSLDSTIVNNPNQFFSYVWIHQMILFSSEDKSGFFSTESPQYSNFYSLDKEVRNLGGVMIPHHAQIYAWKFYDSNIQPDVRVTAFNVYEGLNNPNQGIDKLLLSGAKIGLVGESDSHQGTSAEGGMTGSYLNGLTRNDLLNAVKARDVFASTSFGKPQIYFAMTSPSTVEMGKEGIILNNQKPTFRIKLLMSKPITNVQIRRGTYGGTAIQDVNLNVNSDCTNISGRYLDCKWTETSSEKFNFYFVSAGTSTNCLNRTGSLVLSSEQCLWSSPIWVSRSGINYVYGDNFNQVGEQGKEVNVKTKFFVNPGQTTSDIKNMAIFLSNDYPTKSNLSSFKLNTGESTNLSNSAWFDTKTNKPNAALDFKVRNVNGSLVFTGFDLNKVYSSAPCNTRDDSCNAITMKAGEAKTMYLNTNGSYTFTKTACSAATLNNCSYAWLNGSKSSIVQSKFSTNLDSFDITWNIGFDPIVGERVYELYTNSFNKTGDIQGWRRAGSIFANPTVPTGSFKAIQSNSDSSGNINLQVQNAPTDDAEGIKGVGNIYFKITDVASNQACTFSNEDWYSVSALITQKGSNFTYKLKGPTGQRKLCYYFKDIYGISSQVSELLVNKIN